MKHRDPDMGEASSCRSDEQNTNCLLQGKPATSHVIAYLIPVTFKWQQLLEKQFDPVSCEFRDAEGLYYQTGAINQDIFDVLPIR